MEPLLIGLAALGACCAPVVAGTIGVVAWSNWKKKPDVEDEAAESAEPPPADHRLQPDGSLGGE